MGFPANLTVLPLDESGGKLTYQVIVTNAARGGAESPPTPPPTPPPPTPFFTVVVVCGGREWGELKKRKNPYCTCGLYRHESFPPRQKEEFAAAWKNSPRGARMTRSAVPPPPPPLPVGSRMGRLECNDEMEKFQRSEHSHAEGNWRVCHQKDSARYAFNSAAAEREETAHRV